MSDSDADPQELTNALRGVLRSTERADVGAMLRAIVGQLDAATLLADPDIPSSFHYAMLDQYVRAGKFDKAIALCAKSAHITPAGLMDVQIESSRYGHYLFTCELLRRCVNELRYEFELEQYIKLVATLTIQGDRKKLAEVLQMFANSGYPNIYPQVVEAVDDKFRRFDEAVEQDRIMFNDWAMLCVDSRRRANECLQMLSPRPKSAQE